MISDELDGRVWLGDDLVGSMAPPEEAPPASEPFTCAAADERPLVTTDDLLGGLGGPSPRVWEEIEASLREEGRIR